MNENGGLNKELWILKLGKKPAEWYKPAIKGKGPSGRFNFTMNFYEDGNFVILYGGRNDSELDNFALSDIWLLELSNLEWICARINFNNTNYKVYSRCGHSAIIHGTVYFLIKL